MYRARDFRLRWEEEKPVWFTEAWKARIPKTMLAGVGEDDPEVVELTPKPWTPPLRSARMPQGGGEEASEHHSYPARDPAG